MIAATHNFFTWANLMVVDRFGRRRILLSTVWGMAFFLALAAVAFHWIPINHDLSLKSNVIGWPAYVVLACMIIYVGFYSSGMENTAWLSSEFFPWKSELMAL